MTTRPLEYNGAGVDSRGVLAEPEAGGKRPGVLVVHEAPGLGDHVRRRVQMLADLGYVALAADLFGGGGEPIVGPAVMERAQRLSQDRGDLRARGLAALDALKALSNVDTGRIAAIGYCFGGSTVIELARAGTALNGIVSFHGGLKTPTPAEPGAIRTKMLLCTGSEDPTIPAEDRQAAQAEFTRGGADWQMNVYGGAMHSFTNKDAPGIPGFGYHPDADRRSWTAMQDFFAEIFA